MRQYCTAVAWSTLMLVACDGGPMTLELGEPGSTSAASGRGSFRLGAATAATQIEDQNPGTDWYAWTAPAPEGLGRGEFVGDGVQGFSRAVSDVDLITNLALDSYRFSVEWGRIEPARDQIDEDAVAHYAALLDALTSAGVRPMITVHHFSNPLWVSDPRQPCTEVTAEYLCGWDEAGGADAIIEELAEHARLLAERYGDRVDDWATLNEPINYMIASHGVGFFPPGNRYLLTDFERFMDIVRRFVQAHVAMYRAIQEADVIDADGDGIAASIGLTLNVAQYSAVRDNRPSTDPADIAAAERVEAVYHYAFVDSLLQGAFDADLDGSMDEDHPEWLSSLDWLGVQYYSRTGVSATPALLPGVDAMVCFGDFDLGSCLPPEDPTHWIPDMRYEWNEDGIREVLVDFADRWQDLPLIVTESGLATRTGRRRAEHVVRSLEQILTARDQGVDVRGYYHWSLLDNFEWAEGYEPTFGLYTVDRSTFERTPTEGAEVLAEIARTRTLTRAQREGYGGRGPLTPE